LAEIFNKFSLLPVQQNRYHISGVWTRLKASLFHQVYNW